MTDETRFLMLMGLKYYTISPLMVATSLWQVISGHLSPHEAIPIEESWNPDIWIRLQEEGEVLFPDRFVTGYAVAYGRCLERVRSGEYGEPEISSRPMVFQRRTIEDALIEVESLIRRIVLNDLGVPKALSDSQFEDDRRYKRAIAVLATCRSSALSLGDLTIERCTNCNSIGETGNWFGYRETDQVRRPQSWCRVCRSIGESRHQNLEETIREKMETISGTDWFVLSAWGKETGVLTPWERKFSFSMGRRFARGDELTEKQDNKAFQILVKALKNGFEL